MAIEKPLPIKLDENSKYLIRVRSVDNFGVASDWSESIVYNTAVLPNNDLAKKLIIGDDYITNYDANGQLTFGLFGNVISRTNHVKNPSFEINATGYSANTFTSIARSTEQSFVGEVGTQASLKITASSAASGIGFEQATADRFSVTPGLRYTASLYVYVPVAQTALKLRMGFKFYTGGGSAVSGDYMSPMVIDVSNDAEWHRIKIVGLEAPTTSASAALRLETTNSLPLNSFFYVDGVLIEQGDAVGDYFDGSTSSEASWTGTVHASTSILSYSAGSLILNGYATEADIIDTYYEPSSTVVLPGSSGNYISTSDHASLDVAGSMSVVAFVSADDWTPSVEQFIVSKTLAPTNQSWQFSLTTLGELRFAFGNAGGGAGIFDQRLSPPLNLAIGEWKWVAATFESAGVYTIRFFTSDDGVTWTQLGTPVPGGSAQTIFAGTADLMIGSAHGGTSGNWDGKISRTAVYSGIGVSGKPGGTLVAEYKANGLSTFTDSTGKLWTVNGGGVTYGGLAALIGSHGDLWIDTSDNNKIYRWNDIIATPGWELVQNSVITGGAAGDIVTNNTTITGGNISTGTIRSSGWATSPANTVDGSVYSTTGTLINLDTGAVVAKNFRINTSGDAFFRGSIVGGTIDIGGEDATPATSFHVDINGNMWVGATTYATAPFQVSNVGNLSIGPTSGSGRVHIESFSTLGRIRFSNGPAGGGILSDDQLQIVADGFITIDSDTDAVSIVGATGVTLAAGSNNIALFSNTTISANSLSFGSSTRQMLNLFSTTYALGVQNSTMYFRGTGYAWYSGGTHSDTQNDAGGGSTLMRLDSFGFSGPNSTAGLPTYSFINDRDSGMYLVSSGIVGISVNNSERLRINGNTTNAIAAKTAQVSSEWTLQGIRIDGLTTHAGIAMWIPSANAAPVLRAFSTNGEQIDCGNNPGTGYAPFGALNFVTHSSAVLKQNIRKTTQDDKMRKVSQAKRLQSATWDDKDPEMSVMPSKRFAEVNERWTAKGHSPLILTAENTESRPHICNEHLCSGTTKNPCGLYRRHYDRRGFVAEDVLEVFPQAVVKNSLNEVMGIDYSALTAEMWDIMQVLIDKIELLESKLPTDV